MLLNCCILLVLPCVIKAQVLAPDFGHHHPGGPQNIHNDLPVFGSQRLDTDSDRQALFGDTLPEDTILLPPPKTSTSGVRDIVTAAVERAIHATHTVTDSVVEAVDAPAERQLAFLLTILCCGAVVFCGVLPALLLPIETGAALHNKLGHRHLNLLLSFAVGSLVGDVCLHILPETYGKYDCDVTTAGLWCIAGLILCFFVEKCCAKTEESQHRAAAMLNLVANLIDNFTHGLAVASSFLINVKFGLLTTLAILLHEIPHEISDFAILLRADFNRVDAVKAQLCTATGGVIGAAVALGLNAAVVHSASVYILAFTAGGFLNIALVEILPELLKERNPWESMKQLALILLGVVVMGSVNLFHFV